MAVGDIAQATAQKGGGGGGGGGRGGGGGGAGGRSGGGSHSAPAVRSAPTARSTAPGNPVIRSAPNARVDSFRSGNSPRSGDPRWSSDPRWNGSGRYYGNYDRWNGGYYGYHHHHHNDFWRFFLYASIADAFGYHPFGFYSYGYWPYAAYYGYPDVFYGAGSVPVYPAAVANGSAAIEVLVPLGDAQVWIDGTETTSSGTSRRYTSPPLRSGYDYSYSIKASWTTDDGETRTVERQVPLSAGGRVLVDFTQSPSRVMVGARGKQ